MGCRESVPIDGRDILNNRDKCGDKYVDYIVDKVVPKLFKFMKRFGYTDATFSSMQLHFEQDKNKRGTNHKYYVAIPSPTLMCERKYIQIRYIEYQQLVSRDDDYYRGKIIDKCNEKYKAQHFEFTGGYNANINIKVIE
jgi:hypothetical protein